MGKQGRSVTFTKFLKRAYRHADFLAKLTKISFISKRIEKITQYDEMFLLTKDNLIQINQEVEKQDEVIVPSKIVEHFINMTEDIWLMNECLCRESIKCKDYPIELGCLFLGKAANGINPKLGVKVTKEEALEHIEKCRQAGLIYSLGRNAVDAKLLLGVDPPEQLLTICNCCPCCCITRNAKNVKFIDDILKKMPGVEVKVTEKCIGCGTCTEGICFIDAIQIIGERAVINHQCRGCGRCVEICPQNAIELTINDEEYINKTIERITRILDIT